MSLHKHYEYKSEKLKRPQKKEFETFKVVDFQKEETIHKNITADVLKEKGYTKPSINRDTAEVGSHIVVRESDGKKQYEEAMEEYMAEEKKILEEFKEDLFKEVGMTTGTNRKIADAIYERAWQEGHSEGLGGVEREFHDYEEMVDEILKIYSGE